MQGNDKEFLFSWKALFVNIYWLGASFINLLYFHFLKYIPEK